MNLWKFPDLADHQTKRFNVSSGSIIHLHIMNCDPFFLLYGETVALFRFFSFWGFSRVSSSLNNVSTTETSADIGASYATSYTWTLWLGETVLTRLVSCMWVSGSFGSFVQLRKWVYFCSCNIYTSGYKIGPLCGTGIYQNISQTDLSFLFLPQVHLFRLFVTVIFTWNFWNEETMSKLIPWFSTRFRQVENYQYVLKQWIALMLRLWLATQTPNILWYLPPSKSRVSGSLVCRNKLINFFQNRPSCKGYSLRKILTVGQTLNFQKRCQNSFYKSFRVVLCKKPLQKTLNISEMRPFWKSAIMQRL